MKKFEMMGGGLNNIAVALIFQKLQGLGIELNFKPSGKDMNHTIHVWLPNGSEWFINSASDWFKAYRELKQYAKND